LGKSKQKRDERKTEIGNKENDLERKQSFTEVKF